MPHTLRSAPVAPLVLAAGLGTRFGAAKLVADVRGRPLVWHTLQPLVELTRLGVLGRGIAVVREGDGPVQSLVEEAGLEAVINPDPELGLSNSLRLGLDALARLDRSPRPSAALIVMGDQPLMRAEVIERLITTWRQVDPPIVRPRYAGDPGRPGHPVLLAREAWPLAQRLSGDAGFGQLLKTMPDLVSYLEVPGANPDVDTPGDLKTLDQP